MRSSARLAPGAGVVGALLVAGLVAACGDEPSPKAVRMKITTPVDTAVVHERTVEVAGRVRPARARVMVAGRPATVEAGRFRAVVPLDEGANVIDVGASARGAPTAWSAVRVARQTLVAVPDLAGNAGGDVAAQLAAVGLDADVHRESGFLDPLVPGDAVVCELRPAPGTKVAKHSTVTVTVAKLC